MGKKLLCHTLSPVPAWNLHSTAETRIGPRRPPTFAIAIAWIPATGAVGIVEAIIEGQSRNAGQQEQQDQDPWAHCSAAPTAAAAPVHPGPGWGPGANWEEKENKKPIREAPLQGAWDPSILHTLNHFIVHYEAPSSARLSAPCSEKLQESLLLEARGNKQTNKPSEEISRQQKDHGKN